MVKQRFQPVVTAWRFADGDLSAFQTHTDSSGLPEDDTRPQQIQSVTSAPTEKARTELILKFTDSWTRL